MTNDNFEYSRINILIVDDEVNVLKSLRRVLLSEGFKVYLAGSGKEGLNILKKSKIDFVISDYKMPEMNGIEFLLEVKKLYPKIYRIILSGYIDENVVSEAILKGIASTFIGKPWEDDALIKKIKQISKIYLSVNNKKLIEYINSIEKLPSLPEIYNEISSAIERGASARELEDIIKKDISFATEILHIANSIYYSSYKTVSLRQAIVRVGFAQLKNIIIINSLRKLSFSKTQEPYVNDIFNIAFISSKYYGDVYISLFNEKIKADYLSLPLPYNIGKLLLLQFEFEKYLEVIKNISKENQYSFSEAEKNVNIEFNHKELGSTFLSSWNLPEIFVEASLFYDTPDESSLEYRKEITALCAMDKILSFLRYGDMDELKDVKICGEIFDYEELEPIMIQIKEELKKEK